MSELPTFLASIDTDGTRDKQDVIAQIKLGIDQCGYSIAEEDSDKPWGGYLRFPNDEADDFIGDFFPDLSPTEARLGVADAGVSPKILLVRPDSRLSWQYHERRAERWKFLTPGAYIKSETDDQSEAQHAEPGDVVQFAKLERHRLIGGTANFAIVAEIWQHTDPNQLSDEEDIIRLEDDFKRV